MCWINHAIALDILGGNLQINFAAATDQARAQFGLNTRWQNRLLMNGQGQTHRIRLQWFNGDGADLSNNHTFKHDLTAFTQARGGVGVHRDWICFLKQPSEFAK